MIDDDDDDDGDRADEPALVPTFPPAPVPPKHVAVTRVAPPAPSAPVELGPFRTAGAPYVDRRAGSVVIATRPSRAIPALLIVFAAALFGLAIVNGSLVTLGMLSAAVLLLGIMLRDATWMRTNRIEVTATHVIAWPGGSRDVHRLPRGAVTRLACAPDAMIRVPASTRYGRMASAAQAAQEPRWGVYTYDGDTRIRLADVGNRTDAAAIAAQLADELGLPTWVPASDDDDDR